MNSIKILGPTIGSNNGWRDRRSIIDPLPVNTVLELRELYERERISLGIVKPTKVIDLKIEETDEDWKPEWKRMFSQLRLFGDNQRPLKKIPFKFSYVFECADSSSPHNAMIEDWELGALWLKEVERKGDEWEAALSVRHKFLDEMCHADRDTSFFMGTTFPHNSWVVLGVYWPPFIYQPALL